MHIVYVQSYPIYHDGITLIEWLKLENRDKWMPSLTAAFVDSVELWVATNKTEFKKWAHLTEINDPVAEGLTFQINPVPHLRYEYNGINNSQIAVRIFQTDYRPGNTKNHISNDMVRFAQKNDVDCFMIKGVDGGVGLGLIKKHILPNSILFAFIIGGKCKSPHFRNCHSIFYESESQLTDILEPHWFFGARAVTTAKLRRLAKSVDTELFKPMDEVVKKYDVITTGRLIPYYKKYNELIELAKYYKVGVIGGGPMLEEFRSTFPQIDWIGYISNSEVPKYLNKSRSFIYTSENDYFPRAIAEAASSGLPIIAFDNKIGLDVIPGSIGILVNKSNFIERIQSLLKDPDHLRELSLNARVFAIENWSKFSARSQIIEFINDINP
jgi:glycosyltransferase involved in cell wall biosynthesis